MRKDTFPFSPPINLSEEEKRLIAVTYFEAINSAFKITDENNSFSFTTPSHSSSSGSAETINKLQKLLELRCQNDIDF